MTPLGWRERYANAHGRQPPGGHKEQPPGNGAAPVPTDPEALRLYHEAGKVLAEEPASAGDRFATVVKRSVI